MVTHKEFKEEIAGGTIPFNLNVKKDGDWKVRCPKCDSYSFEDEFKWVDTTVEGGAGSYEVQSVSLECPVCSETSVFR